MLAIILCSSLACDTMNDPDSGNVLSRSGSWIDLDSVTQANQTQLIAKNLVSQPEATELARAFATAMFHQSSAAIASVDVQVDDRTGAAWVYAVRFERGFLLLSADKRQAPILAYSDTNDFDLQALAKGRAPEGIRGLLLRLKEQTHDIREGSTVPVSDAHAFDRLAVQLRDSHAEAGNPAVNIIVPNPGNCTGSYVHTYELPFAPVWTQGCGYNANAPLANGGPCGHAAAGCVAVAVGQIMRYYAYPGNFDWGTMADGSPTPAAAALLRDVGDRVDTNWGADASGANLANAAGVFRGYGYSTLARYTDVFWSLMPDELKAGRPVLMKGARDCDFLGFQTCAGHAWDVTGVMDSYDCATGTYGRHYKLNWGWGGPFNGWYIDVALNPNGKNYNFFQGVVLGIHP